MLLKGPNKDEDIHWYYFALLTLIVTRWTWTLRRQGITNAFKSFSPRTVWTASSCWNQVSWRWLAAPSHSSKTQKFKIICTVASSKRFIVRCLQLCPYQRTKLTFKQLTSKVTRPMILIQQASSFWRVTLPFKSVHLRITKVELLWLIWVPKTECSY